MMKVLRAFGGQPKRTSEFIGYLDLGLEEKILTTARLAHLLCGDENEKEQRTVDMFIYISRTREIVYIAPSP